MSTGVFGHHDDFWGAKHISGGFRCQFYIISWKYYLCQRCLYRASVFVTPLEIPVPTVFKDYGWPNRMVLWLFLIQLPPNTSLMRYSFWWITSFQMIGINHAHRWNDSEGRPSTLLDKGVQTVMLHLDPWCVIATRDTYKWCPAFR
jgi:hypothetical protein